MPDWLSGQAIASARRVAHARAREGEAALLRRAIRTPSPPPLVLQDEGFDLFAEIKRRSPSTRGASPDHEGISSGVACRAGAYSEAGAATVSVLTEPDEFGGSLEDLRAAARAASVPVMRKDFLIDPYQAAEARAAGAGGVLLILRLVDRESLSGMIDAAGTLGLFVLLEAFDEADLERANEAVGLALQRRVRVLAGLNGRDLTTLEVDRDRLRRLAGHLPAGVPRVAESGLDTPADVGEVAAFGYDAALVGRALMADREPAALARRMLVEGRDRKRSRCASA